MSFEAKAIIMLLARCVATAETPSAPPILNLMRLRGLFAEILRQLLLANHFGFAASSLPCLST
ncbi:MAG: hypothetical protein FWD98_07340, partial [Defluviitaleaceae bacterium]|nr:hypothetical protein [Defluviitaleaceae bacterium]